MSLQSICLRLGLSWRLFHTHKSKPGLISWDSSSISLYLYLICWQDLSNLVTSDWLDFKAHVSREEEEKGGSGWGRERQREKEGGRERPRETEIQTDKICFTFPKSVTVKVRGIRFNLLWEKCQVNYRCVLQLSQYYLLLFSFFIDKETEE